MHLWQRDILLNYPVHGEYLCLIYKMNTGGLYGLLPFIRCSNKESWRTMIMRILKEFVKQDGVWN